MSRIGKKPITIPAKIEVRITDEAVFVKGPHGELSRTLNPEVTITKEGDSVIVTPVSHSVSARALWGTYASHVLNMLQGVQTPYVKKLIIEGVGYRVALAGKELVLTVGFSHPVKLLIPEGLAVSVEKNEITISGIDKEKVGQFAADVRKVKKPEPYKGKGIRYSDEVVRRKQGKKTT